MGLAVDSNNRWRSAALQRIPVRYVAVEQLERGRVAGAADSDAGLSQSTAERWLAAASVRHIPADVARIAMTTARLSVVCEIGTVGKQGADTAMSRVYTLPYDYTDENSTNVNLTHSGRHFPVRPEIDETVVDAMYSAQSADEWMKVARIKLPRVNNNPNHPSVIPDAVTGGSVGADNTAAFEELRREGAVCAKTDDYGDRLHSLARIVCHSVVRSTLKVRHEPTDTMQWANMTSMLAVNTPSLTAQELRRNSYHYLHTDLSSEYRAFLVMGARGVQHYVGRGRTAYSACITEPEVGSENLLVFVRVAGELGRVAVVPPVDAYLRVLDNPDVCLSMYYAYAVSMGLGASASHVLAQTAVCPHMWGREAVSIYKMCRPKLDACRYVIRQTREAAVGVVGDVRQLVYQSAYIACAIKAGIGALLTSFKAGRDVSGVEVLEKNVSRVADADSGRSVLLAMHQCFQQGNIGLSWLTPFSYDVQAGLRECVSAWRHQGILVCAYNIAPVSALSSVVHTGVEMHNAILGCGMVRDVNQFAQAVVSSLAAGEELPCMCESLTGATLARLEPYIRRLREWKPVAAIVHYAAVMPPKVEHTDSPPEEKSVPIQEEAGHTTSSGSAAASSLAIPVLPLPLRESEMLAEGQFAPPALPVWGSVQSDGTSSHSASTIVRTATRALEKRPVTLRPTPVAPQASARHNRAEPRSQPQSAGYLPPETPARTPIATPTSVTPPTRQVAIKPKMRGGSTTAVSVSNMTV
jgi:hypothetical protein